jgi:type I restriction enzyme, S subunit
MSDKDVRLQKWGNRPHDVSPPDGWHEVPLAAIADIRFSSVDKKSHAGEKPVRLCNYTDVYNNEYIRGDEDFMRATASDPEIARFAVEPGDVIITKDSETPDDIGIPVVIEASLPDLLCGYHLAMIRPKQDRVASVFLAKQLAHERLSRYFARLANGLTRYGLSTSVVENMPLWLPSLDEQQFVASILRGIDEAIAKSEALIAKLKAIKQGLLHDLLIRGLDDNGELRDSERHPEQFMDSPLGRVPRTWEVVPLGSHLTKIDQGWSPSCDQAVTPAREWGVLKTTAVRWEGYFDQENKRLPSVLAPIPAYEVLQDDVLMTRAGPNSRVGVTLQRRLIVEIVI